LVEDRAILAAGPVAECARQPGLADPQGPVMRQ
jgi:hypothetical protein